MASQTIGYPIPGGFGTSGYNILDTGGAIPDEPGAGSHYSFGPNAASQGVPAPGGGYSLPAVIENSIFSGYSMSIPTVAPGIGGVYAIPTPPPDPTFFSGYNLATPIESPAGSGYRLGSSFVGAGGSMVKIYDSGFLAAPAAAVATPVLPTGFVGYQLWWKAKGTVPIPATLVDTIACYINGDLVLANYENNSMDIFGAAVLAAFAAGNTASIGEMVAGAAAATRFGTGVGWIQFPEVADQHPVYGLSNEFGAVGDKRTAYYSYNYTMPGAITTLTFAPAAAASTFVAGSRFIVYGLL